MFLGYLEGMQLPDAIRGMCQMAELDLDDVPSIRIRKGQGNQDIYVELRAQNKKVRAYYNVGKGGISELDIRQLHESTNSSKLLDVANQLADEQASMDAFRLGLMDD